MDNILDLKSVLETTYKSKDKADNYFNQRNYFRDQELSNIHQRVFINPMENKGIVTFRGTYNLISDLPADLDVLLGTNLFGTRLNQGKDLYKQVKEKYPDHDLSFAGHSLGSHIASSVVTDKNDKIYSYNKGAGLLEPFKQTKNNETSYRTPTDIVSLTSANKSNTETVGYLNLNPFSTHSLSQLDRNIRL